MRGIERLVTGLLLAAAVCGSAVFARNVDRAATAGGADVQLTAAPPQHVQTSRVIQAPLYPLLTDHPGPTPAKPSLDDGPGFRGTPSPARRIVVAPIVHRAAPPGQTPAPTRKPVVGRPEKAPGTPTTPTQQSDSRILAKVPLTPTHPWAHVKGIGHGKLRNHPDDDEAETPPVQQQSGSLTPPPSSAVTVVVPAPPQPGASNDSGRGHAYGRLKQAYNDHD